MEVTDGFRVTGGRGWPGEVEAVRRKTRMRRKIWWKDEEEEQE